MTRGAWVSLFSGGKDSSWALYRALESGLDVSRLLTVHPAGDSYMYHVPATELAGLAAQSIGIPLVEVTQPALEGHDSTDRGDAETETLLEALRELGPEIGGVGGVIVGAVESEFQTDRIETVADRLDADLYAPLWHEDPIELGEAMLDAGFEIRLVQVAAHGLDASWVGRHPLGEGGEFETLVTDAPHMDRPIEFEAETVWEGTRGHLAISDAWLGSA
ncbi:MAG: diphthine--ammonia ligase [Halodesulfurarchaeum sp.]